MKDDKGEIHTLIETWQSATKSGDLETVLGLMTDDVVFLVHGRAPMNKAEFAAISSVPPGSPRPKLEITSEIQDIQVSGEMAYAWCRLSVSITPPNSVQSIERSGHTLSVFRRIDGKWLLHRDANLLSPIQHPNP